MFMTEVQAKMQRFGFSRKVAVLLTRIERGIDSLEVLSEQVNIRQAEWLVMAQYLASQNPT